LLTIKNEFQLDENDSMKNLTKNTKYILKLEDLSSGYGNAKVLKDVSMRVEEKSVVALLGANGSGKSTLLKTIIGEVKITKGRIHYFENLINGTSPQKLLDLGIGFVPQKEKIFPNLSVKENIFISAQNLSKKHETMNEEYEKVLDFFPKLRSKLSNKAGSLSGGEQQLVAISRVLLTQPKLLIIDELSIGLSTAILELIAEKIILTEKRGMTILLAEQNVNWATSLANKVYILKLGSIALCSETPSSLSEAQLQQSFLT
jgi:branched-chain amino acid transport system ATP-binding protein